MGHGTEMVHYSVEDFPLNAPSPRPQTDVLRSLAVIYLSTKYPRCLGSSATRRGGCPPLPRLLISINLPCLRSSHLSKGLITTMRALTSSRSFSHGLDLPVYCALPSVPSASNHPTPVDIALSAVDVQRVLSIPLRSIRLRSFASRLTPAPGRIEFLIVRTTLSFPVALHPCFHRRSYFPLLSSQRTG